MSVGELELFIRCKIFWNNFQKFRVFREIGTMCLLSFCELFIRPVDLLSQLLFFLQFVLMPCAYELNLGLALRNILNSATFYRYKNKHM